MSAAGVEAAALVGAALAALLASFLAINLGLRAIPEGRAFLAAARAEGRLLANPSRHAARPVKAVFALALVLALIAAVLAYRTLAAELAPLSLPRAIQLAEAGA